MTQYRALSDELVPIAEAARTHLASSEGVRRFKIEEAIAPSFSYRPTLFGETGDHGLIAVEVNEGRYTETLDRFVLECLDRGLPIRLFVAAPVGASEKEMLNLVRRAKKRSIGVLEVDGNAVTTLMTPLSLSLTCVRPIDLASFPRAYRSRLQQAEETFKSGDAPKGCGRVYDLIESRSKAIALDIQKRGLWKPIAQGVRRPTIRTTTSWQRVLEIVDDQGDFRNFSSNGLRVSKPLWGRIRGLTPHRNSTGHEPRSRDERLRRDRELRTRFEHAVDTLRELIRESPRIPHQ